MHKMTKSGSITIEEYESIKSEAEQVLIAAKIANADRTKPVRIDNKTVIFVKKNSKNALGRYLAKLKRQQSAK